MKSMKKTDEIKIHSEYGDIYKGLCQTLINVGEDIAGISRQFSNLATNCERVDFAYRLLNVHGLFPEVVIKSKNQQMAKEFREIGNNIFKLKKDKDALLKYTESIANANLGSEDLGVAFANRSAVLFEHKLYKECLQDISRAFSHNYPQHLHKKLQQRKEKAEGALHNGVDLNYHEELPSLSYGPNKWIECASDGIEIKFANDSGRHVVATRDLNVGDVIAVESPFTQILLKENYLTHCYHCLRSCYNLIPCYNCPLAMFCTEDCKTTSWNSYHKYECPILATLLDLGYDKLTLIALKICILAKIHYDIIDELKLNEKVLRETVYRSECYREIHNLIANTHMRSTKDLFERAVNAAVVFELLQKGTEFFTDLKGEWDVFKELLLLHMQTGPSNFHDISEFDEECCESVQIGAGAYAFLSLLNHACSPNVVRHCYGNAIVLRALRPISKGDQLFDNYGYHHAVMSKNERQSHLKRQYHFECTCEVCINNWPLYHELPINGFDIEVSEEDMSKLKEGNVQVARRIFRNLLNIAEALEMSRPCRELANVQEIIKQCYTIFGNKRRKL